MQGNRQDTLDDAEQEDVGRRSDQSGDRRQQLLLLRGVKRHEHIVDRALIDHGGIDQVVDHRTPEDNDCFDPAMTGAVHQGIAVVPAVFAQQEAECESPSAFFKQRCHSPSVQGIKPDIVLDRLSGRRAQQDRLVNERFENQREEYKNEAADEEGQTVCAFFPIIDKQDDRDRDADKTGDTHKDH